MTIAGALLGVLCIGFFLLAFGGAGVYLIYRGWQQSKQADASKAWPGVTGQVLDAHVSEGWSEDSDGDRQRVYSPAVSYTYQVGGQVYTSSQVSFGFKISHSKPGPAQAVIAKYPPGGQVTVYYDPANPSEAVLERRAGGLGITFVIGVVFVILAVCMACPMVFMAVMQFIPVSAAP